MKFNESQEILKQFYIFTSFKNDILNPLLKLSTSRKNGLGKLKKSVQKTWKNLRKSYLEKKVATL